MSFKYERIITDDEEKIFLDQVLDVKDWIDKAISGKINNCVGHCAKRRRAELLKRDRKQIPASELDLCKDAFADPEYKNRSARDLAESVGE